MMFPRDRECGVGSEVRVLMEDETEARGVLTRRDGPFGNQQIEIELLDGTVLANPTQEWCFR